jgi:hypothetical protein
MTDESRPKVTIVKCRCGDEVCKTYGLSDGTFYQGNGWPKERAQQYADAINAYDGNVAKSEFQETTNQ